MTSPFTLMKGDYCTGLIRSRIIRWLRVQDLPHASLRVPLVVPVPTNGTGSAKRWQPRTPAMAAGLTDHVWTLREVLLFRVPPWPQPAMV